MRTLTISLAAAASALAFATPAAAQYWPAPVPQGYAYGYNNHGTARALQIRVDQLQRHIARLEARRMITRREARSLREESRAVEFRLRETSRYGLNPREQYAVERRIARLEQRIQREIADGRRWGAVNPYGYNGGYGGYGASSGYGVDRDRDGRDDRYEDDRGFDHD